MEDGQLGKSFVLLVSALFLRALLMLLVTGAGGLLGANVLLKAREMGQAVTGFCHRHLFSVPGVSTCAVDLTDRNITRDLVISLRPKRIVHCAAATNVDWCEEHPEEASAINTHASGVLAELAQELGAQLVYISTDAVFDGKRGCYQETDEPAPLNVYAESKLRGEQEVLRRNPSALVVRVNIYGWNAQNKFSLAEWILAQLLSGKQVPGFTDVQFTPILVNDLAEVLLTMLDRGLSGLYHVGGSEKISKFEFARRVASVFGLDPGQVVPARIAEAQLRAQRPPDMSLNTEKVRAALGYPMPDVETGLRRFRELQEAGYPQKLKSYLHEALQ